MRRCAPTARRYDEYASCRMRSWTCPGARLKRRSSAKSMQRRSDSRRWAAARWRRIRATSCSRAARRRPICPMIMSGASLSRLEDVRQAGRTAWFQAYLPGETGPITELVNRVAAAGFDTLVLTVDVPVGANREKHRTQRLQPSAAPDAAFGVGQRRCIRAGSSACFCAHC